MDADLLFRFVAFVFLMLCSAGFSASETALFSLPASQGARHAPGRRQWERGYPTFWTGPGG